MSNSSVVLNGLVVIWLLITGLGALQARQLQNRADEAKRWLRREGINGMRKHAADASVRMANARMVVQVCLFTMGLVAISLQFFPPDDPIRIALSSSFRLLMIVVASTLTFKSRMEIHELDRIMDETERSRLRTVEDAGLLAVTQIETRKENTEKMAQLTNAIEAQTFELQNGPLHAQLDNTRATDELKASTDELKVSTDAATLVVKTQIDLKKLDGEHDG